MTADVTTIFFSLGKPASLMCNRCRESTRPPLPVAPLQVTANLFGWRKNDLEGKPVTILLPPPYSLIAHVKGLADGQQALTPMEVSAVAASQQVD